jgi:phosphate transport system protein
MPSRLEISLERDIDRIRQQLLEMSGLAERALRDCVEALGGGNRQRAYAVVLRDQLIDEKEKEIDRLCLEFLLRQQPVGIHLRFAYSAIKVNLELERIGDYAESIARQILRLNALPEAPEAQRHRLVEMADLAIPMLHDSVEAFVKQDAELAKTVVVSEPAVDALLGRLVSELVEAVRESRILPEMLVALSTMGRRFERVADQARNVCMETLYMCTGQYAKHPGSDTFRILFVDEHNACRSQMAEAIAQSLGQPRFVFSSAGLDPRALDPRTVAFLKEKGHDVAHVAPKGIDQVPNLEYYNVVVGVAKEAQTAFPRTPRNLVYVDWAVDDPSRLEGSPEEVRAAYEATYAFLSRNVRDLVGAVLGITID